MSEEIKRITVEDFNNAINDVYMPVTETEWNGLTLYVKKNISFKETLDFVKYVTELCFAEDTHEYLPEARDLAIKIFLIQHYTNIDLPDSLEERNKFIYETDIVQTVLNFVNPYQFNEIIRAIDLKIDYMADANIEAINNKMDELYKSFEELSNSLETVFGGINEDSMVDLVNAIKDGRLDEGKLVEAYFDTKGKQTKNEGE